MAEPSTKALLAMTTEEHQRLYEEQELEQAKRAAAVPRIRTIEELRAMTTRQVADYLGELAVANLREAQRRYLAEEAEERAARQPSK